MPLTKQHLTHVKVPREHLEAYCVVKNVVIPEWKSNKEAVIDKTSFFSLILQHIQSKYAKFSIKML